GAGGFGITYLAEETPLARQVTIKEYFPVDFAIRDTNQAAQPRSGDVTGDYQWGLDRFLDEARTLARFDHPNIVRVYRFFRENNSGFMVLHFEDGKSFKAWLKSLGRAPRQHELDRVVPPLLDALALIHGSDFLHRDIAPDNIIIRTDGSPVLIDFGSARSDIAQHSRTVSALVKPGYSPYEQYATTGRQQGPWTDIYSLGATLYQAVTGKRPPDSPSRMVEDELVPARDAAISAYRPGFLAAIDAALTLDVNARPRSIDEWRKQLLAPVARIDSVAAKDAAASASEAAPVAAPEPPRGTVAAPGAEPKSKIKAKAKVKESGDGAPAEKKASPKASLAADSPLPQNVPRRPASEGRVAAIFREWRARRAARPMPASPLAAARASAEPVAAAGAAAPVVAAAAAAQAPAKSNPPAVVERRAASRFQRPKKKRSWRPLIIKGLIGLTIAGLAVAYQNALPRVERQGEGTISSGALPGPQIAEIKDAHKGAVDGVGYTSDGRQFVTIGDDGTLKLWDSPGRTLVRTFDLESTDATALAVGDTRVVTAHRSGRIALWDLELGVRLAEFKRNDADIHAVAFAGSPDRILAASHDWKLTLFDARTPILPVHVFDGHESAVQAVAYSAARKLIASGGADRTVRLWNAETFEPARVYRGHQDFVTTLAFAADGRTLASGDLSGTVRIWSMTTRRAQRAIRAHKGGISALAYSSDGNWLATAGRDGLVKLWDMARPRPPRVFTGHVGDVRALSFAPDGATLASAGADGVVRFWSTAFMVRRGS
ncbi:MAG: serine/threonine-protein kinase, partial [Hyphomicrobiaceae bacterium]